MERRIKLAHATMISARVASLSLAVELLMEATIPQRTSAIKRSL
jgi:hypothetical protein